MRAGVPDGEYECGVSIFHAVIDRAEDEPRLREVSIDRCIEDPFYHPKLHRGACGEVWTDDDPRVVRYTSSR